ncbi:MAG: hypothetical protein JWR61_5830 [Ferruginibacter sp.]|uniref:phage neck terminator protein n=1 Tax=Ferruginibacter sp. TaxID=1940288 RepID=UPI002658333A|nr:hypothetical protein [Ferruginibacter sp.]MDB5280875.1 hypothetical protein [Ferruginibacter sp.]
MSLVPTPTQSGVLTALRAFLVSILPTGVEVIQAQDNRVPEPKGDDFVTMTPLILGRLSTNVHTYDVAGGTQSILQPTRVAIQLDVHGPNSADNAQTISTLFRDDYAARFFAASGANVAPFFADDPKQMPFTNEQQQVESRWVVDAVMQANQAIVGIPQQFADHLDVSVFDVQATYPL